MRHIFERLDSGSRGAGLSSPSPARWLARSLARLLQAPILSDRRSASSCHRHRYRSSHPACLRSCLRNRTGPNRTEPNRINDETYSTKTLTTRFGSTLPLFFCLPGRGSGSGRPSRRSLAGRSRSPSWKEVCYPFSIFHFLFFLIFLYEYCPRHSLMVDDW